jgi:hypothetical protein
MTLLVWLALGVVVVALALPVILLWSIGRALRAEGLRRGLVDE